MLGKVEAKDYFQSTALHHAASKGHRDVVQLLAENGANIDVTNNEGATELHVVVTGRNQTLQYFPDRFCPDREFREGREYEQVIQLPLDRGADVWKQNQEGATPMELAEWHGLSSMHEIFRKHIEKYNLQPPSAGAEAGTSSQPRVRDRSKSALV